MTLTKLSQRNKPWLMPQGLSKLLSNSEASASTQVEVVPGNTAKFSSLRHFSPQSSVIWLTFLRPFLESRLDVHHLQSLLHCQGQIRAVVPPPRQPFLLVQLYPRLRIIHSTSSRGLAQHGDIVGSQTQCR